MTDGAESARPLVLVLVGTDHHPFDRLVEWCDELATARTDVDVLVQHGSTHAPQVAAGMAFLDKDELTALLERAHVAVTHGGPGLISDVQAAGLMPVVVARKPDLGEHVDGHQRRFVARIAKSGIVSSADDQPAFDAMVEAALAAPRGAGVNASDSAQRVADSVARFAALIEPMRPPRR